MSVDIIFNFYFIFDRRSIQFFLISYVKAVPEGVES
jgi:hypothetical protein